MAEEREDDERVLLSVSERIEPQGPAAYIDRVVQVPEDVGSLRVELDFDKATDRFQLYAALLDPRGVLRGHVQCPGGPGPREQRFIVGERLASPGCVAGPIPSGGWTLRIDLDRFREPGSYALRLVAGGSQRRAGAVAVEKQPPRQEDPSPDGARTGWLRGELHAHSVHSDGADTVPRLVDEAERRGLDFLALSDHFTWSHWEEIPSRTGIVVMPSLEVTTHRGHGNAHGLSEWVDVYVDAGGRTCADLVAEVHAQGGLFGVNHPFSGQQAWRRSDLDWAEVDLLEVVNQGQDANNDAAIGLWDRLLAEGHDIAPVAGTDCHDIADPAQRLGQVMTAVKTTGRSREALLAGLRSAATVVTRGAGLDLRLRSGGTTAGLGETLPLSGRVRIEVDVETEEPGTLYVIRDGLMWLQEDIDRGGTAVFLDEEPVPGCYRVELHRRSDQPRHWASAWRSHESFEALTSFIRTIPSVSAHHTQGES